MSLDDVEVVEVTRLIHEKEKDLELAAKIGQELLERNRCLDDKVAQLEAQVSRTSTTTIIFVTHFAMLVPCNSTLVKF
jgi:hypothetical protein